jgi:GH24 family phage-related lysozyme (muramidase)
LRLTGLKYVLHEREGCDSNAQIGYGHAANEPVPLPALSQAEQEQQQRTNCDRNDKTA